MQNAQRILANTQILYGRLFISSIVSLISTRIVLQTLGITDYGIFILIVGVVGILTVLNSAMGTSTLRFLGHSIGEGDNNKVKAIFSTLLVIHVFLAAFIVVLFVPLGHFLIENFILNIPEERIEIAYKVYLAILLGASFNIVTLPFDGVLTAHENFKILAVTELIFSFSRLCIAVFLPFVNMDKLMAFSGLMAISTMAIALFKQIYCVKKYDECGFSPINFERGYFIEMTAFAGWNLIAAICSLARGQGLAVATNVYFGVAVNAALGIAEQISGLASAISSTVRNVIYPQLLKAEGGGDRERMLRLSFLASKFPSLLIALLGVPLIIEMAFILDLWLKEVPDFAVGLTRLLIILVLVSSLSYGIEAAVQSIGKIKVYQIIIGTILIFGLSTAVLFFELKFNVFSAFMITIFFEIIARIYRMFFLRKSAKISVSKLFMKIDVPVLAVFLCSFVISFGVSLLIENGIIRLLVVVIVSSTTILTGAYWFMLEEGEKKLIQEWRSILKSKLFNKLGALKKSISKDF